MCKMRKVSSWVLAAFVLVAGVNVFGQASQPTTEAAEAAVAGAVKTLRASKDVKEWVDAVGVIARSSDGAAWEALRAFLVDPDALAVLKVRKTGMADETASVRRVVPEYAAILRLVAESGNKQDTLLWLLKQKPYMEDEALMPPMVLLDALQYVREPEPKLLAACEDKFAAAKSQTLRRIMMNVMAAWGTPESLALYKKYAPWYGEPSQLIRHRDRLETLKLLVEDFRGNEQAGAFIEQLCGDFYNDVMDKYPLPAFAAEAKQAGVVADVLEEFRQNPGKAKLTAAQELTLKTTVEKLRAQAAKGAL
jgi:hypothetical protein